MKILDYFIIALVLIWLIAASGYLIKAMKQGKSICCGNSCSGCSNCNLCKNGLCESRKQYKNGG